LHPGGASVLLDEEIGEPHSCGTFVFRILTPNVAGQDATEAFYGLHKHEVIEKPQYARLQVGFIGGEKSKLHGRVIGELSKVPYAEPTWLTEGYHSPFYTEVYLLSEPCLCFETLSILF